MRKSTLYLLLTALALLISPAFPQGGINLNDDAKLFLPPAGADFFPATKGRFVVELNGTEQGVLCSGPTTIERGDPIPGEVATRDTAAANGRNVIDTEIVALDLFGRCPRPPQPQFSVDWPDQRTGRQFF